MIKWTCKYCGEDTTRVDYDYLIDTNHLSCALKAEEKITLGTSNPDRRLLLVEVDMISRTPNDQELGAKVRKLYYETYHNS